MLSVAFGAEMLDGNYTGNPPGGRVQLMVPPESCAGRSIILAGAPAFCTELGRGGVMGRERGQLQLAVRTVDLQMG